MHSFPINVSVCETELALLHSHHTRWCASHRERNTVEHNRNIVKCLSSPALPFQFLWNVWMLAAEEELAHESLLFAVTKDFRERRGKRVFYQSLFRPEAILF